MRNLLKPFYYTSADIFAEEQVHLFRKTWVCVGSSDNLENNNDFLCCNVGGKALVVQNFDGKLAVFENVCSHRFNQLQCQEAGNRPLVCGYHGWKFNHEGTPTAIPSRPRFDDLCEEVLNRLKLRKWRVECCGKLVFVCKSVEAGSLREFLGGSYDTIEAMANACGTLVDDNRLSIKANWKITVENTLESYHVSFIHPKTFAALGVAEGEFAWQESHSSWDTALSPSVASRMNRFMPLVDDRPAKFPGYFHQLVFPNITLATTYGTTFSIQFFEPLGERETLFRSLVFESTVDEGNESGRQALEVLGKMAVDFNRKVFLEDKVVCESVQVGVTSAEGDGILSDEELRVSRFQQEYLKYVGQK